MKNRKLNDGPVCKKQNGSLGSDGSRGGIDALQIWTQMEDLAVPRLRLSPIDHAIYSYLLRHSRLEGKLRLRFSIGRLSRGTCMSTGTAREAVRRLIAKGVLRLTERTKAGHVVEVRVPEEIRGARPHPVVGRNGARDGARLTSVPDLEEIDFLESSAVRQAIHDREGGRCFYCMRRLTPRSVCLDHVVPRVQLGSNSYRNVVSACGECNSQKGEMKAEDFLLQLHRQRRLSSSQLGGRLRALEALAAGELRPRLPADRPKDSQAMIKPTAGNPLSRKPCPPYHPENLGSFSRPRKPGMSQ